MPTSWNTYVELAKRNAQTAPKKADDVWNFFTETLPTFSVKKQEKIIKDLLGDRYADVPATIPFTREYAKGVPIPKLSESKELRLGDE